MDFADEDTVEQDRGAKQDLYAQIGVREYWRYDPTGDAMYPERLTGERLVNGAWVPITVAPDIGGIIRRGHSDALDLDLCVRLDPDTETRNQLWLFDRNTGEWLRNLKADEQRASTAEHEIARLRERLAELGVSLD